MSCRIENGRAVLPNGKDSKLLKDLRDAVGSNAEAEAIYESIYSEEFKKFYGFDFEKQDINQIAQYFNNLDENNEPRLFQGIGIYEFLNNKSESFPVALSNKQKNKVLDSIGKSAYNGVDIFEGTAPLKSGGSPSGAPTPGSPLSGIDPSDPGVNINALAEAMGSKWKKLAGGK